MHAFLILPLLLALTPQQKQLIKMVKQGDIFAGDDLARSVCDIDEGKRKREAEAVLKRLKKVDNKAKEIAVEGIEKCMPKDEPKAAEAKKKEDQDKDKKDEEKPAEAEKKEDRGRRPATEGTDVADAEEGGERDGKRRPIVGMIDEAADEGEGTDEEKAKQNEVQRKAEEAKRKAEEARLAAKEAKLAAREAKKAEKARKAEERRLAAEARKAERARKAEEKRLAAEERKAKALAEREERKRKREEERERKLAEAKQAKEEKIAVATETERDDPVIEEGLSSIEEEVEDEVPPLAAIDDIEEEAAPATAAAATTVSATPEALRSAMMSYGVGGGLAVVSSVGFLVALGAISIGSFQTADIISRAQGGEPDSNAIATTWLGAGTVALLGVAAGAAELAIGIMLMQSGSELVDQATGAQPAKQD